MDRVIRRPAQFARRGGRWWRRRRTRRPGVPPQSAAWDAWSRRQAASPAAPRARPAGKSGASLCAPRQMDKYPVRRRAWACGADGWYGAGGGRLLPRSTGSWPEAVPWRGRGACGQPACATALPPRIPASRGRSSASRAPSGRLRLRRNAASRGCVGGGRDAANIDDAHDFAAVHQGDRSHRLKPVTAGTPETARSASPTRHRDPAGRQSGSRGATRRPAGGSSTSKLSISEAARPLQPTSSRPSGSRSSRYRYAPCELVCARLSSSSGWMEVLRCTAGCGRYTTFNEGTFVVAAISISSRFLKNGGGWLTATTTGGQSDGAFASICLDILHTLSIIG